mgnify:CR=1 FL=1
MIIVLKQHAPDEKVKAFCNELQTIREFPSRSSLQTASSTRTIPWWKWVIRKSRLAAAILP